MRSAAMIVLLAMAFSFSLFAVQSEKINTGQILKNEVVVNPSLDSCEFTIYTTVPELQSFERSCRRDGISYNDYISNPVKNVTRKTLSPKEDYGVIKNGLNL